MWRIASREDTSMELAGAAARAQYIGARRKRNRHHRTRGCGRGRAGGDRAVCQSARASRWACEPHFDGTRKAGERAPALDDLYVGIGSLGGGYVLRLQPLPALGDLVGHLVAFLK